MTTTRYNKSTSIAETRMQTLNRYLTPILHELERFMQCYPLSNEHQIIKHLQTQKISPFETFSLADSKDLFNAHFLCMHALYQLKKQYQLSQKYRLVISAIQIQRITINEVKALSESSPTSLDSTDPLESYYLNSKHYFDTQKAQIEGMLTSFWQKYLAQDEKNAALAVLNLPANADAKMVKTRYLQLVQKHHPDKGGSNQAFNKIQQAKTVLDKAF